MARSACFVALKPIALAACIGLAACSEAPDTEAPVIEDVASTRTPAEQELARLAGAMQRTILEGAAAGAAVGGGFGLTFGDSDDVGTGITIGAGAGALAGTYVAFVQRKYLRRERRLRQIEGDLERNAEEMEATLTAMRQVLVAQQAELASLRLRLEAEPEVEDEITREVAEANDNLSQMQLAIEGASQRQAEFTEARGLTLRRRDTESPIDAELALLSNRIAQMQSIASDLANSI